MSIIIDDDEYIYDYKNENFILNSNYEYNNNFDMHFWENLLGRKLNKKEKKIFYRVYYEKDINNQIKSLKYNLMKHNCYITIKTKNSGNCLYESLVYFGLGNNNLDIKPEEMIKKSIAITMLSVRDWKDFFPKINLSLEELFINSNEIEMVKEKDTDKIYKYNYDLMILDLYHNNSWTRLPTELILMVISRLYEVKIMIYHNKTEYINIINVWNQEDEIQTIRLGLIDEEHYFPVIKLSDDLIDVPCVIKKILDKDIKYEDQLYRFNKWRINILESLNNQELEKYNKIDNIKDNKEESIIIMKTEEKDITKINDLKEIDDLNDFFNI